MRSSADRELENSLEALPQSIRSLLREHGFSPAWLLEQARQSRVGARSNVVSGEITPLDQEDLAQVPEQGTQRHKELSERGTDALRSGECALSVLAGGMATRMGGVIKALVPAAYERTFLELRLGEQEFLGQTYGKRPPLWLMTSHATHRGIEEALAGKLTDLSLALFRQGLSVRLTETGKVFLTADGAPSLHAPGHGDFVDSLNRSRLLHRFVDAGGKYVLVTNLDNLGGGLDPVLIGIHLESEYAVTCEVVEKNEGDRGGIPVRLDGRPVVLEEFRLPQAFDPRAVSVFSVNNFAFDAEHLIDLDMNWTYFEVTKTVEGKTAVQYERLINEITFHLPTNYVVVPRVGTSSRFLPVKDHDDLTRYHEDLHALAKARGMITSPK